TPLEHRVPMLHLLQGTAVRPKSGEGPIGQSDPSKRTVPTSSSQIWPALTKKAVIGPTTRMGSKLLAGDDPHSPIPDSSNRSTTTTAPNRRSEQPCSDPASRSHFEQRLHLHPITMAVPFVSTNSKAATRTVTIAGSICPGFHQYCLQSKHKSDDRKQQLFPVGSRTQPRQQRILYRRSSTHPTIDGIPDPDLHNSINCSP
ncbi:hypothetical protein ACLOJK_037392, partial [Asimina triloba]